MNEKIFNEFCNYYYPSFLYEDNQNKNEKVVKKY